MRRALLTAVLVALAAAPGPARGALVPSSWQRGLNVTAFWWSDLDGPAAERWLELARSSAHANSVTYVVSWYQYFDDPGRTDALNATEIRPSYGSARRCKGQTGRDFRACKTPSMASLRRAVRRAKARGLRVTLRPQVDVGRDARQAADRKRIDKGAQERAAWFASYKAFLSGYARLARDEHVGGLVVGAGLSAMTNDEADRTRWRDLIADVRSGALMGDGRGGFKGELTYAAAWDSVVEDALDPDKPLFFWDALDTIGIDAYFPLVGSKGGGDPSVAALKTGWATKAGAGLPTSPVDIVRRLQAEYGKPVRFTGLGYLSREGTAAYPEKSDRDQAKAGGRVAQRPQARAVQAAFEVWADIARKERWFEGIDWWEWPASGRGGPKDGSHALEGKAAEATVCRSHGGRRCAPTKRVPLAASRSLSSPDELGESRHTPLDGLEAVRRQRARDLVALEDP